MKYFKKTALILAAATILSTQTQSASADTIELGQLECFVDAGTGFIIGSTKDISCVFTPAADPPASDNYFGVINKFGIDIGKTEESFISWLVIAGSNDSYQKGFLHGDYVGATAEATFAVGLGANVLIGGSNKSIALQPLSIQAQTGLNFAAGIAEIELRSIND